MSSSPTGVLVYGLGAIGSFYAFILSRNESVRLTVVARSNYDAVKANGIKITSENHGEHHFRPYKVVKSVAEAGSKFDYILCANKAIDQSSTATEIEPGVDEERTSIVIVQNGVGNEEPIRNSFPTATIISCVIWVGARQPQPGIVLHTKSEHTQVGLFPNVADKLARDTARINQLDSILKDGGTSLQVVPDVQIERWEKLVWNAAWNSLTTLTLQDTHSWLSSSDDATPMTRKLMREVIDVGRALGVKLEYELIDRLLEKILEMAPIGSSMRTDYENGKPLEVEVILGYPVRKGRELGLDVTTIETIYIILTAINKRILAGLDK